MAAVKWTAADLPDQSGQTAVVTGASSGLGKIIATELDRAGASVVLAVRDEAKGRTAAETMSGRTEVRPLDLANLASVRAFAASWIGDLDILVNNAGIMQVPHGLTRDGFELQMGTNHLGPFALTALLLPRLRGRVVTVSSQLQSGGHIHLDDLNGERRPYNALQAYRDAKLANTLFTLELSRRLTQAGTPVRAMTADPGWARTGLAAHVGGPAGLVQKLAVRLFNDAARGALPTLYAATADIPSGSYVAPDGFQHLRGYPEVTQAPKASRDGGLARQLWEVSARLTSVDAMTGNANL
jgi:NAD(P)-dependent dehydrogenase (short-subunit alcohol dehydrogenase family)